MLLTNIPKIRVDIDAHEWLVGECRRLLAGCQVEAHDGTKLYTPDTRGHYAALRTRDFCTMVEGAGHLIPPEDIAAGIDAILAGQREDGVIPDRVEADGTAVYCAGPKDAPLGSRPPTDNAQFLVKLVSAYLKLSDDLPFSQQRMDALLRGLESVPTSGDGAVRVDPASPHSAYGFTDTVAKTGEVLFSTLLLWEAWRLLAGLCKRIEDHEAAHDAYERADEVAQALPKFWDEEFGMLLAATYECRQLDLWGSAYAVRIGAVTSRQRQAIGAFFADLYHDCTLRGYVRHLVAGQYWERMLADVPHDTYQNGGYWAVPSGWVARCLLSSSEPELAALLIEELLGEFREGGVCEWVSETERALPGYVVSAALLLDSVKAEGKRRG